MCVTYLVFSSVIDRFTWSNKKLLYIHVNVCIYKYFSLNAPICLMHLLQHAQLQSEDRMSILPLGVLRIYFETVFKIFHDDKLAMSLIKVY